MAAVGDSEKPTFRWLDAVRYAVAAVVTLLIVAVLVNAIMVALRPELLRLSVVGGSVFTRRFPAPPVDVVAFYLTLQAVNPSGRAMMYYVNISAYVFDKNMSASTPNPQEDSFLFFKPAEFAVVRDNEAVPQLAVIEYSIIVNGTRKYMTTSSFDMLYNNKCATMSDVTMRLEGDLITQVTGSGHNRTTRGATYYCGPLVVGGDPDDEAAKGRQNAPCNMDQGSY